MENYKEIQFCGLGNTIDDAVKVLNTCDMKGQKVYLTFNNVKIYTYDDIESAYKKVTGMTKTEFDEDRRQENEKYEREKNEHEEKIPELTKEWIEKGKSILDEKYLEKWNDCVPIRLKDLYRGLELECCLNIVERLNNGCTLSEAKELIEDQGHSGTSFSLVCLMIKSFCDRGNDFVEYVKL